MKMRIVNSFMKLRLMSEWNKGKMGMDKGWCVCVTNRFVWNNRKNNSTCDGIVATYNITEDLLYGNNPQVSGGSFIEAGSGDEREDLALEWLTPNPLPPHRSTQPTVQTST